jgi:hypothetical protein
MCPHTIDMFSHTTQVCEEWGVEGRCAERDAPDGEGDTGDVSDKTRKYPKYVRMLLDTSNQGTNIYASHEGGGQGEARRRRAPPRPKKPVNYQEDEDEVEDGREEEDERNKQEQEQGEASLGSAMASSSKVRGSWVSERGSGGVGEGHVGRKRQDPPLPSFSRY